MKEVTQEESLGLSLSGEEMVSLLQSAAAHAVLSLRGQLAGALRSLGHSARALADARPGTGPARSSAQAPDCPRNRAGQLAAGVARIRWAAEARAYGRETDKRSRGRGFALLVGEASSSVDLCADSERRTYQPARLSPLFICLRHTDRWQPSMRMPRTFRALPLAP